MKMNHVHLLALSLALLLESFASAAALDSSFGFAVEEVRPIGVITTKRL
jgi:hypothetical protein